jgi:hypothetical protein
MGMLDILEGNSYIFYSDISRIDCSTRNLAFTHVYTIRRLELNRTRLLVSWRMVRNVEVFQMLHNATDGLPCPLGISSESSTLSVTTPPLFKFENYYSGRPARDLQCVVPTGVAITCPLHTFPNPWVKMRPTHFFKVLHSTVPP